MKSQSVSNFISKLHRLLALSAVVFAVLFALTQLAGAAGTTTLSVAGPDQNWSTSGNGTTVGGSTPPAAGDAVVFGNGAFPASTNSATGVNNIVSASTTVASLTYQNQTGNDQNTAINANQTLTVNGNVMVGTNVSSTTLVTMSGTGNFVVAGTAATTFNVGASNITSSAATLTLADGTNSITAGF